jgi:tight adherence protein B
MSGVAAVAAGLLIMAGLLGIGHGLRRTVPRAPAKPAETLADLWARLTRRPPGPRGRRRDLVLAASMAAGFLVAAISGWVVAILVLPMLALGLPYLLVVPKPRDVELLEALDRWVRSLAATLATGKSITDAIRISRRTAPPLIAEGIGTLVVRLNNRWETDDALRRFADELDSPDADGVIAALMLAVNRGANGASLTLQALADSLQSQLKSRRVIEIERAKPYVVVRQVTVISLITLGGVYLLSPTFFSPYRTPLGQLILAVLLILYLGSLILMRRKARQHSRPRILVGAAP